MIALFLSCILFESSKITFSEPEDDPCQDNPECDDQDGDGFRGIDNDCDDTNPAVHPDATEICDGIDNNCNERMDDQEGIFLSNMTIAYLDTDGDGYGGQIEQYFCVIPADYSMTSDDCDDTLSSVSPGASEICDGLDNDCNQLIDLDDPNIDLQSAEWFYLDQDGDGFGVEEEGEPFCTPPDGYVSQFGDCESENPEIYPTAEDIPNDRIDQNCDGEDAVSCFLGDCAVTLPLDEENELGIDFAEISAGPDPLGNYSLTQNMLVMTTEWTQGMMAFIAEQPHNVFSVENVSNFTGSLRPVERIQWHEAAYTANLLTQYENAAHGTSFQECYHCELTLQQTISCSLSSSFSDIYSCDGYRLPTSAEWEYYTRAGVTADFSTNSSVQGENMVIGTSCNNATLSGGTQLTDYAWFCVNNEPIGTKNVAQKSPNPWGLYDVYGNVSEWTNDDSSMLSLEGENPTSSASMNNARLIRGGFYRSPMINMHNGFKTSVSATSFDETLGFRLLRSYTVGR